MGGNHNRTRGGGRGRADLEIKAARVFDAQLIVRDLADPNTASIDSSSAQHMCEGSTLHMISLISCPRCSGDLVLFQIKVRAVLERWGRKRGRGRAREEEGALEMERERQTV